jgi:selenium metabolism protein YedF
MKTVDARGQLCPKPVLMTKILTDSGEAEISVFVDNEPAVMNVARFLENKGYSVSRSDENGCVRLDAALAAGFEKKDGVPQPEGGDGGRAFLILSMHIGSDSDGLGEVLMKSFLGTISSGKDLPSTMALMNTGVKLALASSSCSETLRELESMGVTILVCGTCTKHFGITDSITAGRISNMFEITESVFGASKPIVIR